MMTETRPPKGTFPGEWTPSEVTLSSEPTSPYAVDLKVDPNSKTLMVHNVLSHQDCEILIEAMKASGQECPVSVFGFSDPNAHGIKLMGSQDEKGSVRATAWSPELAKQLWEKLRRGFSGTHRHMGPYTATDWFGTETRESHTVWEAIGLSPVLRFMRYDNGGQHAAHYDAGYDYGDGRRSLMSVVFYLTSVGEGDGGSTRFIFDDQGDIPVKDRNFGDWTRLVQEHEVIHAVTPVEGSALVFDHRVCHDVSKYTGKGPRIIIRADIVFQMV